MPPRFWSGRSGPLQPDVFSRKDVPIRIVNRHCKGQVRLFPARQRFLLSGALQPFAKGGLARTVVTDEQRDPRKIEMLARREQWALLWAHGAPNNVEPFDPVHAAAASAA